MKIQIFYPVACLLLLAGNSFAGIDLKPLLWNSAYFSKIDSKHVEVAREAAANMNMRTEGNTEIFTTQGTSLAGLPAVPQRAEVEYTNKDRNRVMRFTSVDTGAAQTVALNQDGKIASLTVCQNGLLFNRGGCYSVTPEVCAVVKDKLSDSAFKKMTACEDTITQAHKAIAGVLNGPSGQEISLNIQTLQRVSKDSRIAPLSPPVANTLGDYYSRNVQVAFGNYTEDFEYLAGLKEICGKVLKRKAMDLRSANVSTPAGSSVYSGAAE